MKRGGESEINGCREKQQSGNEDRYQCARELRIQDEQTEGKPALTTTQTSSPARKHMSRHQNLHPSLYLVKKKKQETANQERLNCIKNIRLNAALIYEKSHQQHVHKHTPTHQNLQTSHDYVKKKEYRQSRNINYIRSIYGNAAPVHERSHQQHPATYTNTRQHTKTCTGASTM